MNRRIISLSILLVSLMLSSCGGAKESNQTLVYVDNGARQCEFEGYPPPYSANTLIENGIEVFSSDCGFRTGIAFPAVCGAADSRINLHSINSQHLALARELGFAPVSELSNNGDKGYKVVECLN